MNVMPLMIMTQENILLIPQMYWRIVFYHDGLYQLMNADDDNDDNDDNDDTDKNDNEDYNEDDLTIG